MSLLASTIPSLANGVSQQPAVARLSSQGDEQINAYSSIVEGLRKRPPTHNVAKLIDEANIPNGAFLHLINRDLLERYSVIVADGVIKVFDLATGDEQVVNDDANDEYLTADDDTTAFRAVTIADHTFLLNREITVEMDPRGTTYTITVGIARVGGIYEISVDATEADAIGAAVGAITSGEITALNTNTTTLAAALNTAFDAAIPVTDFVTTSVAGNVITVTAGVAWRRAYALRVFFSGNAVDTDITSTSISKEILGQKGMAYVRQGNYATTYSLTLAGRHTSNNNAFTATVTHTTSPTDVNTIQTNAIALALNTLLATTAAINTIFAFSQVQSVISMTPNTTIDYDWTLSSADSNGDQNLVAALSQLGKFTDLPASAPGGFRTKILGDPASEADDFYVEFASDLRGSAIASGTWEEAVASNIPIALNARTMPHLLVREADGTFTYKVAEWDVREAGDETSNPEPTFVGTVINDIVFFRNRLGFLADENVIMSASGPDYFRFFRATVQTILDGDPIDVAASNVSVSILKNAVPFSQDKMILFSDQKQFVFSGVDFLTPKTTSIKPSTAYETQVACKPVVAGKNLYFPTPKGDSTGLREYSTDATTSVDDAVDVTAHVPAYVPANVFKIAACPNEDVMVLLTRDDESNFYIYKYYFVGSDKLQASWSKWSISGSILDANFIDSTLYLVIEREDGVYLESLGIEAFRNDPGFDFEILLDRRFETGSGAVVQGTYSAATGLTTWNLPYETSETVQAVVRDTPPAGFYLGQLVPLTKVAGNTSVTAVGDWSAVSTFMGIQYTKTYTMSEIVYRTTSAGAGERAVTGGRLQIRRLNIVFDRTGYFRVEVTPENEDTYTYHQTPKILGTYPIGSLELQEGELRVPVLAQSSKVAISIINDSPYPSHILSASWLGEFIRLGRSA